MSLMLGRIYHAVLNLFAVALIARYLKVDVFGEYAFISVVCNIFMVVTDMGINRIGIRRDNRGRILKLMISCGPQLLLSFFSA